MEEMRSRAINEDTKGGGSNAGHNPSDEVTREVQMDKDHLNVKPADTIKAFFQIYLENNALMMSSPDRMNCLLCRSNGFMRLFVFKKGKFLSGNMMGENRPESIGNDLRNNFVQIVTQRYRPIVIEGGWSVRFWNEGNESRIDGIVQ